MGMFDGLFGGGDGPETEKFTMPLLTPEQQSVLSSLNGVLSGQIGKGVPPYPGQLYAGPSNLQKQAFASPTYGVVDNLLMKALNNWNPTQDVQNAQAQGKNVLDMATANFDPAASREQWRTQFVDPAMAQFKQETVPAIMEQYAAKNAADSGALNRSLGRAGVNLSTNLSSQLSNLLFNAEEAQKNRQMQSVPLLGQVAGLPGTVAQQVAGAGNTGMQNLALQTNIGTAQRGIENDLLSGEYQKWQQSQPYNNPWLQYLNPALNTRAFENFVQQKSDNSFDLGGMLGSIGSIAGPLLSNPETWTTLATIAGFMFM